MIMRRPLDPLSKRFVLIQHRPNAEWYLTESLLWTDDPHKAARFCKRKAFFWLDQVNKDYPDSKHWLKNARIHILETKAIDLIARICKAKDEQNDVAYSNAKRQLYNTKCKLRRLYNYGNKEFLLTQCR